MGDSFDAVRRYDCAGALGSDAGIMGRIFWLVPCRRWGERIPVGRKIWSFWNWLLLRMLHVWSQHSQMHQFLCRAADARFYDSPLRKKIILCKLEWWMAAFILHCWWPEHNCSAMCIFMPGLSHRMGSLQQFLLNRFLAPVGQGKQLSVLLWESL